MRISQVKQYFLYLPLMMAVLVSAMPFHVYAARPNLPSDLTYAIVQVAKNNIPAVVHVEITERQDVTNDLTPFGNDPSQRRFFNLPKPPGKFKRELKGLGSGVILDGGGHILTNHHVAGGATKIEVLLSDGRRFPAKLVGTDPKTDLAVIKIAAKGALPHVTFGDSDKVEVGEWVVAIGHPRGLAQTVTQGIISAKHRRGITDPGSYQDFLQTDAAINPGSSGGPLLNLQGEVIGINAVIVSESGGFEGIAFTIPGNMAVSVAKQLIKHGKVIRGWLGVSVRDAASEKTKKDYRQPLKGAFVADVIKGGPADKAGLKADDIIVSYDGRDIADSGMLRNLVVATPIGREIAIAVLRGGKKQHLRIKIENLEEANKLLARLVREKLGVEVKSVSLKEYSKYNLEKDQGVVISQVDARGPLGQAGFEVGDIILGIENYPVRGVESFINFTAELKANQKISILALDYRTGNIGSVEARIK